MIGIILFLNYILNQIEIPQNTNTGINQGLSNFVSEISDTYHKISDYSENLNNMNDYNYKLNDSINESDGSSKQDNPLQQINKQLNNPNFQSQVDYFKKVLTNLHNWEMKDLKSKNLEQMNDWRLYYTPIKSNSADSKSTQIEFQQKNQKNIENMIDKQNSKLLDLSKMLMDFKKIMFKSKINKADKIPLHTDIAKQINKNKKKYTEEDFINAK